MLLKEYMVSDDIITALGNISNMEIFKGESSTMFRNNLIDLFGNRTMFNGYLNRNAESLALRLLSNFGEKWQYINGVNMAQVIGDDDARIITETTNVDDMVTTETEVTEDSIAFNTTIPTQLSGESKTNSDTVKRLKNRQLKDSKKDAEKTFKNLSLFEKYNIMNSVSKDIADFLTLSIY